jgi:hypothetical protein
MPEPASRSSMKIFINLIRSSSFPEVEVDSAVLEALTTAVERKTVFDLEDLVIDFIGDTSRDMLEFSPSLGTYQVG